MSGLLGAHCSLKKKKKPTTISGERGPSMSFMRPSERTRTQRLRTTEYVYNNCLANTCNALMKHKNVIDKWKSTQIH